MVKGRILVWKDVKFQKCATMYSNLKEVLRNIDTSSIFEKTEDFVSCLNNITVTEYVGDISGPSDIFRRARNMGLDMNPNKQGFQTRMRGFRGNSKKVIGILFVFFPDDKETSKVEVYARCKDNFLQFLTVIDEVA